MPEHHAVSTLVKLRCSNEYLTRTHSKESDKPRKQTKLVTVAEMFNWMSVGENHC